VAVLCMRRVIGMAGTTGPRNLGEVMKRLRLPLGSHGRFWRKGTAWLTEGESLRQPHGWQATLMDMTGCKQMRGEEE
jgi:hypothetical protein